MRKLKTRETMAITRSTDEKQLPYMDMNRIEGQRSRISLVLFFETILTIGRKKTILNDWFLAS